ncbi:hypothetical protein ACN2WE_05480 [Streptomyces sp. cg28]|uniref:hypothetical protein n=1 Tax=Streptomyces sp. cg28 TaxID=3403457 RepID=UPI003B217C61
MTVDIAALDTPLPQVEADARRLALPGLLAEQDHQLADDSVWITNPPAVTPATNDSYPGWAERIAALAVHNKQFGRAS